MSLKKILPILLTAFLPLFVMAQVTTSSITGTVKGSDGKPLDGATITAIHQPSGTEYKTTSNKNGIFSLDGLRIGGPYLVKVEFVGYATQTFSDLNLKLGEPYDIQSLLADAAYSNQNVVVSTTLKKKLSTEKQGPTTIFGSRDIANMPTISRNLTDLTRLTPQASGNNFGGRDGRYNNLKVDGVNMNNNFGLSNDLQPGGGRPPVSLDAFDQISVATVPFDVRQSGFTGAAINAVTKSGTNEFHGTAYGYTTNQSMNGKMVNGYNLGTLAKRDNKIYGGSLGGPIIKNKLFFFVNGEYEKSLTPSPAWYPTGGSGTGNRSNTPVSALDSVATYLKTKGYDPGPYQNLPAFSGNDWKILAKIDWNINVNHKLTLKYTTFTNKNDWNPLNNTSIPNGGGYFVTGRPTSVGTLPYSRYSQNSMAFFNSNYGFKHTVKTYSAELNSRFSQKISNQLLATITRNRDTRITPNGQFTPTVDIFDGNGNNYISFGTDPFTMNNDVINNVWSVVDNFTYYTGRHTITAGATYEHQYLGNMFMPGAASYYAYNSLTDFINDKPPVYYAWTYSLLPGNPNPYSAQLKTGQWGAYIQDEIKVNDYFKITAGIRADQIKYIGNPIGNPKIDSLFLPNQNGDFINYSTSKWPSSPVMVSPRVSFRWDVLHDRSLILRGGTGLFTGRFPLVWLTNIPSNAGMVQYGGNIKDPNVLKNIKFNSDPAAYSNLFTPTPNQTLTTPVLPTSYFALADKNFRFPMVWTSDIGIDKTLGNGFIATLEATITKDINALTVRNANLKPADSVYFEGTYTLPRYTSSYNKYYGGSYSTFVIENTSKGYSATVTAQISKAISKGFYGNLAYVYTVSKSVSGLASQQANSLWNNNPTIGTGNSLELGNSPYFVPHRVVASLSYRLEYANHFASTFSLFYQGSKQSNFTYTVNGDINNDGKQFDQMYIPLNQSEMNFTALNLSGTNGITQPDGTKKNVSFTPGQQAAAFEQFIRNSSYLNSHRGQIAQRNAAWLPWYHQIDFSFLQDIFVSTGKYKHTLQFSANVFNFANMLNSKWGVRKLYTTNTPIRFSSFGTDGKPIFTYQSYNVVSLDGGKTNTAQLITSPFQDDRSQASTWQMQLGLRYTF